MFWMLMAVAAVFFVLAAALQVRGLAFAVGLHTDIQVDSIGFDRQAAYTDELTALGFEPLALVTYTPPPTRGRSDPDPVIRMLLVSKDRLTAALVTSSTGSTPKVRLTSLWQSGACVVTNCPGQRVLSRGRRARAIADSAASPTGAWQRHRQNLAAQASVWGPSVHFENADDAVRSLQSAIRTYTRAVLRQAPVVLPLYLTGLVLLVAASLSR
jgi:hypothetical protein